MLKQVGHRQMGRGAHGLAMGSFRASLGLAQSVGGGGLAVVQCDTLDYDVSDWYDVATYTYRPRLPGLYHFTCHLRWDQAFGVDKQMAALLNLNGAEEAVLANDYSAGSKADYSFGGCADAYANGTDDDFTFNVFQADVAARGLRVGRTQTYWSAHLIGRM